MHPAAPSIAMTFRPVRARMSLAASVLPTSDGEIGTTMMSAPSSRTTSSFPRRNESTDFTPSDE